MKTRLLAVLSAAALCMSMSVSLAACGNVENDKNKSKNKYENSVVDGFTGEEEKAIKDAKELIVKWYELMNASKYSEAVKLMTPDYAQANGYDKLTDGVEGEKIEYEIIEDDVVISKDEDGSFVVEVGVKLKNDQTIYLQVNCNETGALLSGGTSNEANEETGDMTANANGAAKA